MPICSTMIVRMLVLPVLLALAVSSLLNSCDAELAKPLVSYNFTGNYTYQLHEDALSDIAQLPSPVVVLAAVGDARIGKSTFLNMVHLHWDPTFPRGGPMPFETGDIGAPCTRGLWVRTYLLPEGGSLVLVDVEGTNLGNDAVTRQLSAFTAVLSSYILLFVSEVVNNPALEFLYHTTELGKMFPDSDNFPHLGVVIRNALKLSPTFSDRHSEVVYAITSPTHKDGNDELREVIGAVFPEDKISVFEVAFQDRKQLERLQELTSGPYYDSVQAMLLQLKKTISPKLTMVNGLEMCGGDLVVMIRKLFTALENNAIATLESAYERLEKQMCDSYYYSWIAPLQSASEDEFMNKADHNLTEFIGRCKINSYTERVKQEIQSKRDGIIREREERKKAAEAQRKAKEEERKAQEAKRRAEEEQRRADEEQRRANEEQRRADEEKRKAEEAEKIKRQAEEVTKQEEAKRKAAEAELARERRRRRGGGGFGIRIGPISFSF